MSFTIRSPLVLDLQNNRLGVGKTPTQSLDVAGLISLDSPYSSTVTAGNTAYKMVEGSFLALDAASANYLKADPTSHGIAAISNVANSGTNAGYLLDTVNSLTGTTSLLALATAGSIKWKFGPSTLTFPDGTTMSTAATGGGGGISNVPVQDEGSAVLNATSFNFVGSGVTATDGGSGLAVITIPGGGGSSYWVPTPGGASGDIQYVGGCVSLNCIQDGGSTLPASLSLTQTAGSSVLQSEDTSVLIPQVITDPFGTQVSNAMLFPIDAWNENYGSTVIYADGTTEIVADPSNFGVNYSENIWHGVGTPISSTEAVYGCADDANTAQFSYPIWYKYNFNTKVWTALTSAAFNGCSGACVYDGGNKVFVSGSSYGASSFYHGNVYVHRYRISNNDWDNGGIMPQPSSNWPVTGTPAANGDHSGGASVSGGSHNISQMLLLPSGKILVLGAKGTTTNLMQLDPSTEAWSDLADGTAYTGDPFYAPTMYLMANGTDVLMVETTKSFPGGTPQLDCDFVIYDSSSDTYTAHWQNSVQGGTFVSGSSLDTYGAVLDSTWALFGREGFAMVVKLDDQTARYANELSGDANYMYRVASNRLIMANLEGQHPSHNYIAKVDFSITAGGSGPPTDRFVFSTNTGNTTTVNGQGNVSYPEVIAGSLSHKASGSLLRVANGSNTPADFQTNGLYIFGDTSAGTYDTNALFLQVGPDADAINTSSRNFWNSPNPLKVFSYNLSDIASGGNHAIASNVLVDTAPADGSWYEHTGYYYEGHMEVCNDSQPGFLGMDIEAYSHHSANKLGQLGNWISTVNTGSGDIGTISPVDAENFNQASGGTIDYMVAIRAINLNQASSGAVLEMYGIDNSTRAETNSRVDTLKGIRSYAAVTGGWSVNDLFGGEFNAEYNNGGNLNGALIGVRASALNNTGTSGTINSLQAFNFYASHQGSGNCAFLVGLNGDAFLEGNGSCDNVMGAQLTAHKASGGTMTGWVYGLVANAVQDTGATGATTSNWLVGIQANAWNNGGTIGNMVGLRVPALAGTGTAAPNTYGIFIDDQTGAIGTNKYAFMYSGTGNDNSFYVKGDGGLVIGPHDNGNAKVRIDWNNASHSYGDTLDVEHQVNAVPPGPQIAIYAELDYNAASSSDEMHAIDSEVYIAPTSGQTLAAAACVYTYAEADGPGTITNLMGLECESNFLSAGACTNNYAIYIKDQSGVGTNNYAMYYKGTAAVNDWYVRADGHQVIGDIDDDNAIIRATWTDPPAAYKNVIFGNMICNSTPPGPQSAMYGELDYGGGTFSDNVQAYDGEVYVAPTVGNTLGTASCYFSYGESDGPGTVTNLVGFYAYSNFISAGAVTNNYGMLIGDQNIGATANWAIFYQGAGADTQWGLDALGKQIYSYTDNTGTPGANTANTTSGKCKIASGASSVVVTNSNVNADTIIEPIINQAAEDATLVRLRYTCTSGSFTIFGNANATSDVQVSWSIKN